MSKSKSISDLVTELQQENESLQSLKKLFNQACKNEFGYGVKELHDIITKQKLYEQKMKERQAEKQGQQSPYSQSE